MKIVASLCFFRNPGPGAGLRHLLAVLAVLWGLAVSPGGAWALDVPAYRGYVSDYADMISPGTEAALERALRSFELTDSTQVAVLTIDSIEGDSLEDFSIRTVDAWKIGQKGKDNGVLFLAVKKDRLLRIEVGRGLEGVITDLAAGRIVDNVIAPRFKAGRFDEGFEAGVAAIVGASRGEFKAEPGRRSRQGRETSPVFTYLVFGLGIVAFLGSVSRPLGAVAGAILLPLLVFLGASSSLGLLTLLLLMPLGGVGGLFAPLILAGFLRGGGGFYLGGGGFGGRSGGSGFGGFGGGGFGGGGASGSW